MISIIMNLTNMSFGQRKTTSRRMRTRGSERRMTLLLLLGGWCRWSIYYMRTSHDLRQRSIFFSTYVANSSRPETVLVEPRQLVM
jgi:hypothetical protein